jgi:hypothetical protein
MAIWYNVWPFGICNVWPLDVVCGPLVYFSILVCLHQEKSGNPDAENQAAGIGRPTAGCNSTQIIS